MTGQRHCFESLRCENMGSILVKMLNGHTVKEIAPAASSGQINMYKPLENVAGKPYLNGERSV